MTTVRYVVAYGGDKRSKDALRLGVQLARSFGAALDIVLVLRTDDPYDPVYPPVGNVVGSLVREQAETWLSEARDLVPDDVQAQTHVHEHQSVAQGILDVAAALDASLIILGAASGGRELTFRIGRLATALLHASPIPVALTPRKYVADERLDTLYCAVGTRPGAHHVLTEALSASARSGVDLHLISLTEVDANDGVDEASRTRAMTLMQDMADQLPDSDVTLEIGKGRTMKESISSVSWSPRGVLLIGSSRLAQGNQTFLGSTAARMLRHLPVPMIVVPHGDDTTSA